MATPGGVPERSEAAPYYFRYIDRIKGDDVVGGSRHVEEFRAVREATIAFFRNLPDEGWERSGTASGNVFTTRALAYVIAGHLDHHLAVLQERYLR